ncbi:MAG: twin-arginine translocase TatA/TatE family subunit [Victivallales bacterium]|nr:twin-arginine translocase TatA/TatE family subunit [Victivallales bacterium]
MTDEKNSKDPDSKKTGNSCGFSIGCLLIIVAVGAVVFFIFIKPALEDAGYSFADLKEKIFDFKNHASDVIDKTDKIYQNGKEKTTEQLENLDKKTDEQLDDLKELDDSVREELNKSAPKLIED